MHNLKSPQKNSQWSTNQTMRWKKGKIEEELTQVAAWSFASYWAEESLLVATQKKEVFHRRQIIENWNKKYEIQNLEEQVVYFFSFEWNVGRWWWTKTLLNCDKIIKYIYF